MAGPIPSESLAVVRLGRNRRWELAPGAACTFGRGRDCGIRIADDPVDDLVSRQAGTLVVLPDGVLVRNESTTQAIFLIGMPGPATRIAPGEAAATMPRPLNQVVIPGRFGHRYTLAIDTSALGSATLTTPGPAIIPSVDRPTRGTPARITNRERRALTALCRPLLLLAGAPSATYREIATELGTTTQTVRTCLDLLRARLSDTDGIPGLRTDDDGPNTGGGSFLDALARWAVESGTITVRDIDGPATS